MLIQIDCTANLGDFGNALPVISGLSLHDGGRPVDLIIRGEMRKFVGIKELLLQQPCINSVEFDDEVFASGVMKLSSWTRMDQKDPNRPIETCRYENWINDNGLLFQVDDNFELQIVDTPFEDNTDKYIIGDRWNHPTIDTRRKTQVVKDGVNPNPDKVEYLDYTKSLMHNLNLIKYSKKPFITTFTGIGILADLMNKETIVCWDEDMRTWDGHPVEFDFKRHYYGNRKSKLVYVKDLVL